MWTPSNFSTYRQQFDFSSSGRGKPTYTTLKADNEVLINMVELFDIYEDLTFQSLMCEHCGYSNCEPGNWLAVRQSGNFILFIPAFNSILEDYQKFKDPELQEYQPPHFFNTKGAPLLTIEQFEKLKEKVRAFKKLKELKTLSVFETTSLYKWDTPHRMLGEFPNFTPLNSDDIIWTSELDNQAISTIIADKLKTIGAADSVHLIPLDDSETVISVFMNGSKPTEWKALCKTINGFELLMGNTVKLIHG